MSDFSTIMKCNAKLWREREWEMRCRGEADLSGWNSNIVRQTRVAWEGVKNVMKCYDWDGLGLKESGQKMFGKRRSDKMYSCCNFDVKPTLPLITHWKWHSRQHKVAFGVKLTLPKFELHCKTGKCWLEVIIKDNKWTFHKQIDMIE